MKMSGAAGPLAAAYLRQGGEDRPNGQRHFRRDDPGLESGFWGIAASRG